MSSVSYLNTVDCVTSFSENLKKQKQKKKTVTSDIIK